MAKNSPDEGKNIKMVEKQAVEASMINLKEYRAKKGNSVKHRNRWRIRWKLPIECLFLLFRSMMPVISFRFSFGSGWSIKKLGGA